MKFRIALLLTTTVAYPVHAGESLPAGQAAFGDGRWLLSLDGGVVSAGVDPITGDGSIAIDGAQLTQKRTPERLDGSFVGGRISYVLDNPGEPTWFGRNLRLRFGYDRLRADEYSRAEAQGPDITTSLDVVSISMDGRAYARSVSGPQIASATAELLDTSPGVALACADTDGANTAFAGYPIAAIGTLACDATPSSAMAKAFDTGSGPVVHGATAAAFLLPGTVSMSHLSVQKNDLMRRGGFAGFAGDYEVSRGITISPSVEVAVRQMRRSFRNYDYYADDLGAPTVFAGLGANGYVSARDVGLRVGLDAQIEAGGGFEFFGGAGISFARRKASLDILSQAAAHVFDEDTFTAVANGTDAYLHLDDTTTALGATFEAGAGYSFGEALGLGPLKLWVSGEVAFDNDVPTYGNVNNGVLPASPILALSPGRLDYSDETTYALKAALTFALP